MTKPTHPIAPDDLMDEILIAMDRVVDQDVSIQSLAEAVAAHLRPTVEMAASKEETEDYLSACVICNAPVDTREEVAGGSLDGCEVSDGRWVCSFKCWEKVAGPLHPEIPDDQIHEAQAKINERFGIGTGRLTPVAEPKEDSV